MNFKKIFILLTLLCFAFQTASAGILISKSNGITLTGADGVTFSGADGVTFSGADGVTFSGADNYLGRKANGITFTGADGVTFTGADGVTFTGADGVTYTGKNGVTFTGADGVTFTGADGATFTGADGVTVIDSNGISYQANYIQVVRPNGVTFTGADAFALTGTDGVTFTGADGVTFTGADGVTFTGADGVTFTGADYMVGIGPNGVVFSFVNPTGVTFTGADGVTFTGADGITITGGDGVTFTGADNEEEQGGGYSTGGLDSVDPELALLLNETTDDSGINAIIVFHNYPGANDFAELNQIGVLGGTKFKVLPMVMVTATKQQIIAVSKLSNVRSIYGNRTLELNVDPFFRNTAVHRVNADSDLSSSNGGFPISGKNVTVAVLDTGVNGQHNDLAGRVVQNVRLVDGQSAPAGFNYPSPVENQTNTDPVSGHGTFVAGVVAANGMSSGGKYAGVAPGAKILGLSAGDLNLFHILSGFDYLLEKGSQYNVRVVNCSFSSNTFYDRHDPVNVATKLLTENNINVVFSAGNSGPGNGTLNPYASAPWVISVGATDDKNNLALFSSRGVFGNELYKPTLVATGTSVVSLRSGVTETGTLGAAGADISRLTPAELPFYTTANGTSFSSPQVAGAIALMLEANPGLSPKQVKDILQRTATPLPKYFRHEVGAGVLNTHAAVLEAAFPQRKVGTFRSILDSNRIQFSSQISHTFEDTVNLGGSVSHYFDLPENTIQAGVHLSWGMGANDLGLQLFDSNETKIGTSNKANLLGLLGNREKIILNDPTAQTYRAQVQHTGGIGTSQEYFGAVQLTKVDSYGVSDLSTTTEELETIIKYCLRTHIVESHNEVFNPNYPVTRRELAASLVKSGKVLQYIAGNKMFSDVNDLTTRGFVESVQSDSRGKLFYDAANGSNFRPYDFANKLITAVALVKAGNLESQAQAATLPVGLIDANQIPTQYRGYVAIALQKGFVTVDGNKFNPNRSLTRQELALGMYNLVNSGN